MPAKKKQIAKPLTAWFAKNRRDLPWRHNRTPYRVWLSEIMLQQTQVKTVVPYYERFLQRWPTVQDLAAAPIDDVLRQWEGLGYYSRARNLHRAACAVVSDHQGEFPSTAARLRDLPGIGPYTSGAIASLAYGEAVPAIDGNVVRVFARLYARPLQIAAPTDKRWLTETVDQQLCTKNPGAFNEALMELGATICTPKNADCLACPLNSCCEAFAQGKVALYPGAMRRTAVQKITLGVVVITDGDKILLRKNPNQGIWAGLWEFPSFTLSTHERTNAAAQQMLQQHAQNILGVEIDSLKMAKPVRHQLTHRQLTLKPWLCRSVKSVRRAVDTDGRALVWVNQEQLRNYPLSKAHRQIQGLLAGLEGT